MRPTKAYAAFDAASPLAPFTFQYRDPDPDEIQIQILYCGVCHTDLHQARNDWHGTTYPCVPGHEIVGRVTKAGSRVKKFKEGDLAAVGCMVDSCRECESCKAGEEQLCEAGPTFTYNSPDKKHGGMTYGGYADSIVLDETFRAARAKITRPRGDRAVALRGHHDLFAAAPLESRQGPESRRRRTRRPRPHGRENCAARFGANVVLFTTSPGKAKDAIRLGAKEVVISKNEAEMKKHLNSFDFILDTVAAPHDINAYLELLKRDATLTLVGVPAQPLPVNAFNLIIKRRQFAGSLIGGIRETQEMLDFCADHGIVSDIELIPIQKINEAYERLLKSDVKYRFVIDMKSLA